jgi:hypothetical protein
MDGFFFNIIKRTEPILLQNMAIHYSQPNGFVGRNICYAITYNGIRYGSIVGGSATMHLPGRDEYFDIDKSKLNNIVNNIFFHVEKQDGKYPCRYFTTKCLKVFRESILCHWPKKYKDSVLGFESLVELPRTGECYLKDGWELIGQTKGFTCKRTGGKGTDSWGGKRVWNKDVSQLRPKHVFVRKV